MPQSAAEKRSSPARRARPSTPKAGAKVAKKGAQSVVRAAQGSPHPHAPTPKRLVRKAAKKAFTAAARKTAKMGAEAVRRAADRAAVADRRAHV